MLEITVPKTELWDEINQEFIYVDQQTLRLEHSLVSISKWESKWHKPYMTKEPKTYEQSIDYVKFMTLTPNVDPNVYKCLTKENIVTINNYTENPMTATTFHEDNTQASGKINNEQVTAEIIYYWMITLNIPTEFQKWHLNRLITLIKVCNIKNTPPKKMSKGEVLNRYAKINAARRKAKKG